MEFNDTYKKKPFAGGAKMDIDTIRIFSYGSNSKTQMRERTGANVDEIRRGFLNNHVRIFAGYSKRWKGGVASIHYKKGEKLYGYIT